MTKPRAFSIGPNSWKPSIAPVTTPASEVLAATAIGAILRASRLGLALAPGNTALEMHQVRYFLALAHTLNFTRAAGECNVTQPSLTRAIKLLEYELGGDLVRRERGLTHLTELGRRMLPLLTQCYESAASARAVAVALKSRKAGALRLALPHGVGVAPFAPHLTELLGAFAGLALRILRGDAAAAAAALREGEADLAIAEPDAMGWERFESWPLFREPLALAFHDSHRFANLARVGMETLAGERLLVRREGPDATAIAEALAARGVATGPALEVTEDADALALVLAGAAVALAPVGAMATPGVRRAPLDGLALAREIRLWAVQGRLREPPAAMFVTQLRAADWTGYGAAPSA